jgi:hypothetical protein
MSGRDCVGLNMSPAFMGRLMKGLRLKGMGKGKDLGSFMDIGEKIRELTKDKRMKPRDIAAQLGTVATLTGQELEKFVADFMQGDRKWSYLRQGAQGQPRDHLIRDKDNPLNQLLAEGLERELKYRGHDVINVEMVIPASVVRAAYGGKYGSSDLVVVTKKLKDKKTGKVAKEKDGKDKVELAVVSYNRDSGGSKSEAEQMVGGVAGFQQITAEVLVRETADVIVANEQSLAKERQQAFERGLANQQISANVKSTVTSKTLSDDPGKERTIEFEGRVIVEMAREQARQLARIEAMHRLRRRA